MENWVSLSGERLRSLGITTFRDVLGEGDVPLHADAIAVAPYGRLWLV